MKTMWSLFALMAASTLVVSASTEKDTVWGEQERPVVTSTEEDVDDQGQATVNIDEPAEDID